MKSKLSLLIIIGLAVVALLASTVPAISPVSSEAYASSCSMSKYNKIMKRDKQLHKNYNKAKTAGQKHYWSIKITANLKERAAEIVRLRAKGCIA